MTRLAQVIKISSISFHSWDLSATKQLYLFTIRSIGKRGISYNAKKTGYPKMTWTQSIMHAKAFMTKKI